MDFFDIRPQKFYLLSTHNRRLLEYASHDHSLEHAVENAFSRIKCIEGGNVCAIYQFDANTLQVMTELSDKYKGQYKNIQQLLSYFKGFKEGDYFIRHQAWAPMVDLKRSMVKIDALANGRDPRREDDIFVLNWGKLYLTYETYSYGFLTDKIKVGEDEADKRVCRFCGRTGKEFFKNESHAIQEALGNRLLISNEECDVCNSEFSESVEKHLYKLMEINRTLSNISGKGSKNHHLEGLNFHIHPDPATLAPIVYIKQEHIINDSYKGQATGKIHLYNNGQISYQGIYKALLKIAIDLMPVDKMPHFTKTGRFVHGDFTATKLPYFSYGEHHAFYEQPVLDLFFRNDRSPRYAPYCTAVLRIFDSIFIFTVPFNDIDGDNYLTADEVRDNINLFKSQEYLYVHEWEDLDALDETPRTPLYKLPLFAQNVPYRYEFRPSTDTIFEIKRDK